ncbi:alternative ribosome-rescue factor A [Photobacterium sp. DNB22_13_2]
MVSANDNHDIGSAETEFGRGKIKDNALKAVVTSQLFKTRVVKAKKGKGSFKRKDKHLGRESYSMAA